jgi:hypothetical protein
VKSNEIRRYVAKVVGREVSDTEVLCNKWRAGYHRSSRKQPSYSQNEENTGGNNEDVDPEFYIS